MSNITIKAAERSKYKHKLTDIIDSINNQGDPNYYEGIVCYNEEECIKLLTALDKMGYIWCTGAKLLNEVEYNKNMPSICYNIHPDKDITYSANPYSKYYALKVHKYHEVYIGE